MQAVRGEMTGSIGSRRRLSVLRRASVRRTQCAGYVAHIVFWGELDRDRATAVEFERKGTSHATRHGGAPVCLDYLRRSVQAGPMRAVEEPRLLVWRERVHR